MPKKIKCKFTIDEIPMMTEKFLTAFFNAVVSECGIKQTTLDSIYEKLVNEWEHKQ